MSLCFRAIPGKLSSFVSGRKPLSKFDRHLQKHEFLEQLSATQRTLYMKTNETDKTLLPIAGYTLHQNLSLMSLETSNRLNEKLGRKSNGKKSATYCPQAYRSHSSHKFNIILSKSTTYVAPTEITSHDVTWWNRLHHTENLIKNSENNSFLKNSKILAAESLHSTQISNVKKSILFMDNMNKLKEKSSEDNDGKPSQEQLQHIYDCLSKDLPLLFARVHDYGLYTRDVIFINNIRGVTTKGLLSYARQLSILRLIGHIRFAHVKCDVIKITMHVEDGTVKARWRIRGVTGLKMIIKFWKVNIWKMSDNLEKNHELWYDGFSTFYVGGNGKIYKHVADKVMPDQDMLQKEKDLRITAKLAMFVGLIDIFNR